MANEEVSKLSLDGLYAYSILVKMYLANVISRCVFEKTYEKLLINLVK